MRDGLGIIQSGSVAMKAGSGTGDQDILNMMRDPAYRRPGRAGDAVRAAVREGFAARHPGPLRRDATGRQIVGGHGGGSVHVQAYERRAEGGTLHQVQAHQRGAPARAWESEPNPAWREQIARMETGNAPNHGYGERGPVGHSPLGRYQMNEATLQEAGWRRANGTWTDRAAQFGVTDEVSFLARPAAQEAALNDVLRSYERQLRQYRAFDLVGSHVVGIRGDRIPITAAGLVAAAHREGAPTVRRYLAHRAENRPAPVSVPGVRGDLSRFNMIEERLRQFATTPYQMLRP